MSSMSRVYYTNMNNKIHIPLRYLQKCERVKHVKSDKVAKIDNHTMLLQNKHLVLSRLKHLKRL